MSDQTPEMEPSELEDQLVQYYGLARDPFEDLSDVFLLTPKTEKLLRLLAYLTRFSHKLIVVTSDAGVGKSRVAEQFLRQVSDQHRYCHINGLADDTPVQILHEIAEQCGLVELESANITELQDDIRQFGQDLIEDGQRCILLIDDADLLNTKVLATLYDLLRLFPEQSNPFHLVLFGRPQLDDNLNQIDALINDESHVFHYQLSRFSYKECCQFIEICFSQADDQDKIPFSKADYLRIYQNSAGVPMDIIAEARQLMFEGIDRLLGTPNTTPKWMLSTAVACSILVAVAVGIFLWQNEVQRQPAVTNKGELETKVTGKIERSIATSLPEHSAGLPAPLTNELTTASELEELSSPSASTIARRTELQVHPEIVVADFQPVEEETLDPAIKKKEVKEVVSSGTISQADTESPPQLGLEAAELSQGPTSSGIIEPLESEPLTRGAPDRGGQIEQAEIVETPVIPSAESDVTDTTSSTLNTLAAGDSQNEYSEDEHRILSLPAKDYTLQLVGTRTEQQVVDFLRPVRELEGFRYFRTELNGAPWYVVIYGSFSDREAATVASNELPTSIGPQNPWIRSVSSIQTVLKSRRALPQFTQH